MTPDRPQRDPQEVFSTRRSRFYYRDGTDDPVLLAHLQKTDDLHDGYYEGMLSDDVGHLLPFGRGLDEGFTVEIAGSEDPSHRELIAAALPSQYGRSALEDALREFLQLVAMHLVGYGASSFEVEYRRLSPTDAPFCFQLHPLYPGSLGRQWGRTVQYVPTEVAEKTTRHGLGYIVLDPAHIVTIELPKALGREVRRTVRFLIAASKQQRAELQLLQTGYDNSGHYDLVAHHELTGELVLRATRGIGWNARGLHRENVLDPYALWRNLRFARFKVQLRDVILEQLNDLLVEVGERIGFRAQVELHGVSNLADIDAALAAISVGDASLTDLLRQSV